MLDFTQILRFISVFSTFKVYLRFACYLTREDGNSNLRCEDCGHKAGFRKEIREGGREVGYFYSRALVIVFLLRKRYRQCDRSHSPLRIRELPASLLPEEDRQTLDRIVKPEMGTVRLMDVLVGI